MLLDAIPILPVRSADGAVTYYATGQEVLFANAIDQATTFIQGTGHQMELEAIRSRTREALRSRVRDGRIAGGSCFGYTLVRKSDGSGRKFTIAIVNDAEAEIVRRIYDECLPGRGIKQIAHRLNAEGIAAPSAGRRGSGSWASGAVRTILLNPRYRGMYVHGRIKKVRQAGGTSYVKADPRDVITTEIAEWRIVDDATWLAVQERFSKRAPKGPVRKSAAKYPLTGLGHCGVCGGAIVSHRVRTFGGGNARMMAYGCSRHRDRGSAVCPVTVYQDMDEVQDALIYQLQHNVLGDDMLDLVIDQIRGEIKAQIPQRHADVATLEAELATARTEQKRLVKAVALADEIPELVAELQQRSTRIHNLETQVLAAKRTQAERTALVDKIEAVVRENVRALRTSLLDQADLREVFQTMFPDGLTFRPARVTDGKRQIWEIEGDARFNRLGEDRFRSDHDPSRSKLAEIETANGPNLELVDGDPAGQPVEKARARAATGADKRTNKRNQTSRFRMNRDPNGPPGNREGELRDIGRPLISPALRRRAIVSRGSLCTAAFRWKSWDLVSLGKSLPISRSRFDRAAGGSPRRDTHRPRTEV